MPQALRQPVPKAPSPPLRAKQEKSPMGSSKASRMRGRKNRMSTSSPSSNTTKPIPIWNREESSSTSLG